MKETIMKSYLLKAMARIQPSAENYDIENPDNKSLQDIAYWAARDMFDDVMFQIQAATDAETEYAPVVHGHWSDKMYFVENFQGDREYGYKCSVCGQLASKLKFCGNCGAKMDEGSGIRE